MFNTYITPYDYLRSPTGQETASLIGNLGKLASQANQGDTQISVTPATTKIQNVGDRITIFDGTNSEVVTVTLQASIGSTTIQTSALASAHVAQTAWCSDGASGSLADEIVSASDAIEAFCYQSLLLSTRTDTLALQTLRASVSKDGVMILRCMNFPIQTVTGISVVTPTTTIAVDPTQAFLDNRGQVITIYQLVPQSVIQGSLYQATLNMRTQGNVQVTYTSGFAFSALPQRIKKAGILLTSEFLSRRYNPYGAIETQQGKRNIVYGLRGDTSGESLLVKEAHNQLSSYVAEEM